MIGIIGAMEKELSLLCEVMGKFETQKIGGFEFYTGKLEGKDATLLRCGIGKVNAAVGCALLIEKFKPSCVINTGSAGGISSKQDNQEIKFGDAVISTGLVYHDVDVTAFNYKPGQLPGQPQIFPVDEKFIKLAETAVDELVKEKILPANFAHRRGLIGSGDVFMHEPARIENVRKTFPGIIAVEMEGAAIAHCCALFSAPVLVIRALSDIAGTESPMSFDEFLPIASKNSAHIVMRIVKKL
ncbi:MAG: 5'-methylthioadenosine/S-adenosylhomocysteine nucleosidase [Treponema sp.]|nr:5'-methylthioadenosine/S-adenosylhomocysteine nucleosidase [Treponema sp.]MCL2238040.1 5'-methylthioadenosine/S-adenosylhomocysteine nucleosidase [Treponema sp.]